jgi:Peptidase family C25
MRGMKEEAGGSRRAGRNRRREEIMTMPDSPAAPSTGSPGAADNLIYFNGIDGKTGQYAITPRTIDDLAGVARFNPRTESIAATRGNTEVRSFGLPPGVDENKFDTAGWGVIFADNAKPEIRAALEPLLTIRRKAAGELFKIFDYKNGEQTRDWYIRQGVAPNQLNPYVVPYYLLIVGGPDEVPFEFQYLLGVDYAVGRLSFSTLDEYARYAQSVTNYESADNLANAKSISYWGTRHLGDGATQLSSSQLINPLANGDSSQPGPAGKPAHANFGFGHDLFLGDDATKAALLSKFTADRPPALLFTASHGMQFSVGQPEQLGSQGALLCQDWPGFGRMGSDYYFTAADVPDNANVKGMVAFLFACFAGGTPKVDQFILTPGQRLADLPSLASQPFVAALPQRLLTHPNGSALAVIAHVDRAWGCSIRSIGMKGSQIAPFRNGLQFMMSGKPIGHVIRDQFGSRFAALSAELLSLLGQDGPNVSDAVLVSRWLERNDAQNYVVLGDPAVRLRVDKLV